MITHAKAGPDTYTLSHDKTALGTVTKSEAKPEGSKRKVTQFTLTPAAGAPSALGTSPITETTMKGLKVAVAARLGVAVDAKPAKPAGLPATEAAPESAEDSGDIDLDA